MICIVIYPLQLISLTLISMIQSKEKCCLIGHEVLHLAGFLLYIVNMFEIINAKALL